MSKRRVFVVVFAAAIGFAVPGMAGTDHYAINQFYNQGQTRSGSYDTCPFPGIIFGADFSKGDNDYGTAMLIDNTGGNWHVTLSGYGYIATTDSNYSTYNKKGASKNSAGGQNVGYWGDAIAFYFDGTCV